MKFNTNHIINVIMKDLQVTLYNTTLLNRDVEKTDLSEQKKKRYLQK